MYMCVKQWGTKNAVSKGGEKLKKRVIRLINNERTDVKVRSSMACDPTSYDICGYQDKYQCTTYSYDYCGHKDASACHNYGYDFCSYNDGDTCFNNYDHN